MTPRDSIKLDFKKSMFQDVQDLSNIVADVQHLRSESKTAVDTIGIYVENDSLSRILDLKTI